MSKDELEEWYVDGTALLMVRASYAFAKPRHKHWGVGMWLKSVQLFQITKFGTETNQLPQPPPSNGLSFQNRKKDLKGRNKTLKMFTLHAQGGERDVLMLAAAEPPPAPLTEAEQQQLISTSRELTLEAAVSKYL